MQKIEVPGLPESDRVFLLESGDYVRSRFRLKEAEDCCPTCAHTRIGEGEDEPHLIIRITMAACNEKGEILRDDSGEPLLVKRHSVSLQKDLMRTLTRAEIFAKAKELSVPLFEAEIKIRREFETIAPDLDEDLV